MSLASVQRLINNFIYRTCCLRYRLQLARLLDRCRPMCHPELVNANHTSRSRAFIELSKMSAGKTIGNKKSGPHKGWVIGCNAFMSIQIMTWMYMNEWAQTNIRQKWTRHRIWKLKTDVWYAASTVFCSLCISVNVAYLEPSNLRTACCAIVKKNYMPCVLMHDSQRQIRCWAFDSLVICRDGAHSVSTACRSALRILGFQYSQYALVGVLFYLVL